jgi:alkylation response protein AidB-like acyl-CoA dehydrogenase
VKAGLLQMPFPEDCGGLGGSVIDVMIIAEELSRKSFDFFTAYSNNVFCGRLGRRCNSHDCTPRW